MFTFKFRTFKIKLALGHTEQLLRSVFFPKKNLKHPIHPKNSTKLIAYFPHRNNRKIISTNEYISATPFM